MRISRLQVRRANINGRLLNIILERISDNVPCTMDMTQ